MAMQYEYTAIPVADVPRATNPIFQHILVGGIQWALGEVKAEVPPNLKVVAPEAYTNPPFPEPQPATNPTPK